MVAMCTFCVLHATAIEAWSMVNISVICWLALLAVPASIAAMSMPLEMALYLARAQSTFVVLL